MRLNYNATNVELKKILMTLKINAKLLKSTLVMMKQKEKEMKKLKKKREC